MDTVLVEVAAVLLTAAVLQIPVPATHVITAVVEHAQGQKHVALLKGSPVRAHPVVVDYRVSVAGAKIAEQLEILAAPEMYVHKEYAHMEFADLNVHIQRVHNIVLIHFHHHNCGIVKTKKGQLILELVDLDATTQKPLVLKPLIVKIGVLMLVQHQQQLDIRI